MTEDQTEDEQRTAVSPKLPYVKPFIRVLDMEDSAGKNHFAPIESVSSTFGPS
jgi:hypothetical protein